MRALSYSQERILEVLSNAESVTYEELVDITGISYSGITSRISELIRMGYNIQRLKNGQNTVLRYDEDEDGVIDEVGDGGRRQITPLERIKASRDFFDIKEFIDDLKDRKVKPKKIQKFSEDKCAVVVLSDLHFGEIILNESGETIYNTEIAIERMETLLDRTIITLKDNKIKDVYIALIGDVVDGDSIYRNHLFFIEKPAIEQVKDSVNSLTKFIKTLVQKGFNIKIGCVRGNHGITNYKNLEVDNWDNVVYDMISLIFENESSVNIDHFTTDAAKVNVLDKHIVLYHGNDIGAQIKTASGLRNFRGMCARYRLSDGDLILVGHLHEFGFEGDQSKFLVRNGSLADASEYALKLNYYGEPCQTILILEKNKHYPTVIPIEVK